MATFAKVKKWGEFQHYKNRNPPWIKLQKSTLDDFDFACLPLASKALAPLLWLLASESQDGTVRIDPDWLAFRLRFTEADVVAGLTPLIDKGFLICASDVLAPCLQDACLETEGEAETEGENTLSASADPSESADEKPKPPPVPYDAIVAAYHDALPTLPAVRKLNDARKRKLRKRWLEDPARQSLDYWREFFAYAAKSDFLTGRTAKPWNGCDFEWLVESSNHLKVTEGKYENRGTQ